MECLEGRFDTFGTFGRDFTGNLTLGGASPMLSAMRASDGTCTHLVVSQLYQQQHGPESVCSLSAQVSRQRVSGRPT